MEVHTNNIIYVVMDIDAGVGTFITWLLETCVFLKIKYLKMVEMFFSVVSLTNDPISWKSLFNSYMLNNLWF